MIRYVAGLSEIESEVYVRIGMVEQVDQVHATLTEPEMMTLIASNLRVHHYCSTRRSQCKCIFTSATKRTERSSIVRCSQYALCGPSVGGPN